MVKEFENICLIVSDSLRFKDIAEKEDLAPFLSRVSREGILLKKFYSTSPWTVPSHASIFSGKLPSEHGCTTENTYFDCDFKVLDELDGRYKLGLSENRLLCDELGFSSGFDKFLNFQAGMEGGKSWKEVWEKDDEFEGSLEKYMYFMKLVVINRDLASLNDLARYLYSKLSKKGFNRRSISEVFNSVQDELYNERDSFIFTNIVSTHHPYTFGKKEKREFFGDVEEQELREAIDGYNHEEYLGGDEIIWDRRKMEIRRRGYLASINFVDRYLEILYDSSPEDTVFIVIGDHGELFGEYEREGSPLIGHHFGTFKELVHVPCFIFSKSQIELEVDEDALFSMRDLPEILRGLAKGKEVQIENDRVRAEYFGLKGYYNQFDRDYPEEFNELFSRRSFSLINEEFKVDTTSDGKYLWDREGFTEESGLNIGETSDKMISRAEILYSHYFNE